VKSWARISQSETVQPCRPKSPPMSMFSPVSKSTVSGLTKSDASMVSFLGASSESLLSLSSVSWCVQIWISRGISPTKRLDASVSASSGNWYKLESVWSM
jgi:hypothetical protein